MTCRKVPGTGPCQHTCREVSRRDPGRHTCREVSRTDPGWHTCRDASRTDPCSSGVGVPVGDAGSVTAELAVGLPVVVLLLVVVLAVVGAGLTRAQCLDGARAGARALALGESPADAAATARRVAGDEARVRTTSDGEWVTVVVEASVPVGGLRLGPLEARGAATARVEP